MAREIRYQKSSSMAASPAWSESSNFNVNVWEHRNHSLQRQTAESKSGSKYSPVLTTKATVSDRDIDSFAQMVLEEYAKSSSSSHPDSDDVVYVDNNLGSYVTKCLRDWKKNGKSTHYDSIKRMPDYPALCELLQEQCLIESIAVTRLIIETIAQAVFEKRITQLSTIRCLTESLSCDDLRIGNTPVTPKRPVSTNVGDGIEEGKKQQQDQSVIISVASPLAADNLIPGDLLEDSADNADTHIEALWKNNASEKGKSNSQQSQSPASLPAPPKPPTSDDEAFPPLNPATQTTAVSKAPKPKLPVAKTGKGYKADDLASTLFKHGPRSRQSSIDDTTSVATNSTPTPSSSPSLQALSNGGVSMASSSTQTTSTTTTYNADNVNFPIGTECLPEKQQQPPYHQQHPYETDSYQQGESYQNQEHLMMIIHHCAEYLVSINPELSMSAAIAASDMCQGNIGAAHCLINIASSAPPICRHLLNSGCYRADCQFSHDVDSHTCIFWLRGRCSRQLDNTSKGSSHACHFLHGFHSKLLQEIPPEYFSVEQNAYQTNIESAMYQNHPYLGSQYQNNEFDYDYSIDSNTNSLYDNYDTVVWGVQKSAVANSSSQRPNTFAAIASQGYVKNQSFAPQISGSNSRLEAPIDVQSLTTVRIPQGLWNPNENRDAAAFHIADPMERYYYVKNTVRGNRDNVIDLHFQSLKTFQVVLDTLLENPSVGSKRSTGIDNSNGGTWIVTGTGHHVGTQTHQKAGGALEHAVLQYLIDHYSSIFSIYRGRDRNGQSGAILIVRNESTR